MNAHTVLTRAQLKKIAYMRAAKWLRENLEAKCGIINPALRASEDGPRDHRGDHPQEALAEEAMADIISDLEFNFTYLHNREGN